MTDELPLHLRVATVVREQGRALQSDLVGLLGISPLDDSVAAAVAAAERMGLIRRDDATSDLFSGKRYWVAGRNELALAVRSAQLNRVRINVNTEAAAILRLHADAVLEAFVDQDLHAQLKEWLYNDAALAHDEWQLLSDAETTRRPLPPAEPPRPEPRVAVAPPKPKPWQRKD